MTYTLDLKELERETWKSVDQDGMWVSVFGLVLFEIAVDLWIQNTLGYWTIVSQHTVPTVEVAIDGNR